MIGNQKNENVVNPRIRCLDEVIALLVTDYNAMISAHADGSMSNAPNYINNLVFRLEQMKAPKARGRKPTGGTPKADHPHFVLVSADGKREYMQSGRMPTQETCTHADTYQCFGPFKTKLGACYRVEKGIQSGDPQVF